MEFRIVVNPPQKVKNFFKGAAVLITMGAVFFTALYFLNQNDSPVKGVDVAGINMEDKTKEESLSLLKDQIEQYKNAEITFNAENGDSLKATPEEIGLKLNAEKTLDDAYSYGRSGNIVNRMLKQLNALALGKSIDIYTEKNEEKFTSFVEFTLSDINSPARNPSFEYNEKTEEFEYINPKNGRTVKEKELFQKITARTATLSKEPVQVSLYDDFPEVDGSRKEKAREEAKAILNAMPYYVKSLDGEWEIEKEDIVSWIKFKPEQDENLGQKRLSAYISENEVKKYLSQFAGGVSVSPVNAKFKMEGREISAFALSKPGKKLDVEKSAKIVKENLENHKKTSALVFNEVQPEITSEDVNELGINSLLGEGTTNFAGSPASRKHNIRVGSDKYQGKIIRSGEVFSFNRNLGPVTAAAGYKPELVIKQGETVPEYGGGICQVSTTLFRAAVKSGLEITDRTNHSYPVEYYGTPGFDATIYPPNPDLKFKNNTDAPILIQYNIVGTKLNFEIYGEDDGRKVAVDGPHPYDRKSSGAVKAWLKQTVLTENGNKMHEQTFYSNYKSPQEYPVQQNPLE